LPLARSLKKFFVVCVFAAMSLEKGMFVVCQQRRFWVNVFWVSGREKERGAVKELGMRCQR